MNPEPATVPLRGVVRASAEMDEEKGSIHPKMGVEEAPSAPQKVFWYRSVFFQVTVLGACAFLAPGLYNAMTLTGAGGAQSPFLVNAANAILYALLSTVCALGGFVTNKIGFKYTLILGASGYCIYAAGLYTNKVYGTQWLVLFGAAMCGISGGLFWAAEGAIMIGYPEPGKVGRYLGYWLAWRNAGTVVGGAINLGLNAKTKAAGSLSSSTYISFIVLQAIGPFVGFLLSEPDKVQRRDGSKVKMKNSAPIRQEARALWTRVIMRRDVWLLLPIMLYAQWFSSYMGTYLSLYFNVRSRALASFVTALVSILGNFLMGLVLDSKRLSKPFRARFSYAAVFLVMNNAFWIWQVIIQHKYIENPVKGLDWTAGGRWFEGWAPYVLGLTMYSANLNLLYWVMSTLSEEGKDLIRLAGFLRGVESAGNIGGYGFNTNKNLTLYAPMGFSFGLSVVAGIIGYPVIHRIGTPKEKLWRPPLESVNNDDQEETRA